MNKIVKVISTIITGGATMIKFLGSGKNDVQEKNQISPFGVDSNPIKDLIAVYSPTSEIGNEVIIGYIQRSQIADPGEIRIFSTNAEGDEQISLYLKKDGTAEFGGSADNMVRYSELKSAFDELKGDFNSLVNAYNSHIHVTTATVGATPVPGVIATPTTLGSASSADISPAKIDEIKTS